jgi:hypothetical protein
MLLMMTKPFHLQEMWAASKDRAWPITDLETWAADGSAVVVGQSASSMALIVEKSQ